MNPVTEDIKDLLVAQGLGTFQVDLFIGDLPDAPGACTVVALGVGRNPGIWQEWQQPGIQILVRGEANGYVAANSNITSISNYLHTLQVTINGARYALISQEGDIIYLGKDESNRPLFSANFRTQRTSA